MIDLSDSARALFASGKGILAADESVASADKRLEKHGIKPGPKMRRAFRDMLLATPGIEAYLSGVILHEETLKQSALDETPFPELLQKKGIVAGIKVDGGTEPMAESPEELITGGLLGLSKRLHAYKDGYDTGFTKWRAVIRIEGDHLPSASAIVENAKRLAMSSRCVQEAGMVPILEPEVLYAGTHSRLRSREVITETMNALMQAVGEHSVDPAGLIIKTSMALSGDKVARMDSPEEVAEDTVGALMDSVPADVAGIVFLSGGQTPDQSIANLSAISKLAREKGAPWPLTFSFARTFQQDALDIWKGKEENVGAAREAFLGRLKEASQALLA